MPADGTTKQNLCMYMSQLPKASADTRPICLVVLNLVHVVTVQSVGDGYYSVDHTPPLLNKKDVDTIQFILEDPSGDIPIVKDYGLASLTKCYRIKSC